MTLTEITVNKARNWGRDHTLGDHTALRDSHRVWTTLSQATHTFGDHSARGTHSVSRNRWNQKRTMNRDTRNERFKITHMDLINTFLLITCTIDSIVDSRQPFGNNEGSMERMQEFFRSTLLPYRAINQNEIANSIDFSWREVLYRLRWRFRTNSNLLLTCSRRMGNR